MIRLLELHSWAGYWNLQRVGIKGLLDTNIFGLHIHLQALLRLELHVQLARGSHDGALDDPQDEVKWTLLGKVSTTASCLGLCSFHFPPRNDSEDTRATLPSPNVSCASSTVMFSILASDYVIYLLPCFQPPRTALQVVIQLCVGNENFE